MPAATATLQIHADHGRETVQKLGEDESYELTVTDSSAKLTASTTLALLRGLQISPSTCRNHALRIRRSPPSPSKISLASPGAACSSTSAATSFPST